MADELGALLDALQSAIVPPTAAAAALPSAADLAFERTLSRKLARSLDAEAHRVLQLATSVLHWAAPPAPPKGALSTPQAELDPDLLRDGAYSDVTERIERLLELADDNVERHLGIGKARAAGVGAVGAKSASEMDERERARAKAGRLPARLLHDAAIDKPQRRFTQRTRVAAPDVDDASATGDGAVPLWKPVLRRKVNALSDDAAWLETELYEPTSSYTSTTATSPPAYTRYAHPYAAELAALTPPAHFSSKPSKPAPHPAGSFDSTPFEWVGDAAALERMIGEIRQVGAAGQKDLAIDLEHHDFRSWSGITCLIQLSTRTKDYVIDALEPSVRDGLDQLNEFFTNPEWIKVLHGASSDIVWLQRDFGLYIVGLFDTYHATKVLGHSQHSLASLLDMYTDFEPDKRYQLADWRIRPLPKEMLHYARSDTHYLLSIYDHLRIALHDKAASSPSDSPSPLEDVYQRSRGVSAITFSLAPYDHDTGHFDTGYLVPLAKHGQLKAYSTALAVPTLPIKTGWGPGELKLELLRAVWRWRERTARDEDESARFVLGVQSALQLVEAAAAGRIRDARDVMQVLGAARGGVSEVVRRKKDELAALVEETRLAVLGTSAAGVDDVEMVDTAAAGVTGFQLGLPAEEPAVRPTAGLWDAVPSPPIASTSAVPIVPVAPSSAFYGSTFATAPTSSGIVAGSSSFFGAASSSGGKKGKGKAQDQSTGRHEVQAQAVKRVHDSLVLGGGLGQTLQPKLVPAAPVDTDVVLADAHVDAATAPDEAADAAVPTALSADHTYVPLSARVPKPESSSTLSTSTKHVAPTPKDSDVIVVSSLKDKPKKRRRQQSEATPAQATGDDVDDALPGLSSAASGSATPKSPPAQPPKAKKQKKASAGARERPAPGSVAPHDYSAQRSILDAEPVGRVGAERREQDKKARKKEARAEKLAQGAKKGFQLDTSEFGRAPRVNNAPKKANVSKTFGKGS
ncbi:hypothetical protein Rhopal_001996-T1 [Rhodotorula paludigena]|uniref:3'-5' exonuclease domain-containing protein n=1 Tax=Rhodotorula paludigena TaxID=86838 RepID=A0AAV5GI63_9BASI|nr:hypothetical protein Rhopal_001996-T1 [Rhodotorula paludigena]